MDAESRGAPALGPAAIIRPEWSRGANRWPFQSVPPPPPLQAAAPISVMPIGRLAELRGPGPVHERPLAAADAMNGAQGQLLPPSWEIAYTEQGEKYFIK